MDILFSPCLRGSISCSKNIEPQRNLQIAYMRTWKKMGVGEAVRGYTLEEGPEKIYLIRELIL